MNVDQERYHQEHSSPQVKIIYCLLKTLGTGSLCFLFSWHCRFQTGSEQKTFYFTVIASPSGPISIARPAFSLGEEGVGTLGAGGQGPRWGGRGDGGEDSLSVKGLLGLALWGGGQGHDREGEAHGVEGESRHP